MKPKLDRFIIEQSGGEILLRESNPDWFINGSHSALNYKIKTLPVEVKDEEITRNFGSFFGAMGEDNRLNPKFLNIAVDDIRIVIICFVQSLRDEIQTRLNNFFALTNFGTRQNKGFGSFSLKKIEDRVQIFPANLFSYNFDLPYPHALSDFHKQKELMESIDYFYRSLRSGINLKGRNQESYYFKSCLFCYLQPQGIQWDKKTIKANYFNKPATSVNENSRGQNRVVNIKYLPSQQVYYGSDNENHPDILRNPTQQDNNFSHKLYRDRLGLSSDEKWYSYRDSLKKTEAKELNTTWVRKRKDEDQILRYKSPIFFKPIFNRTENKFTVFFDVFEDDLALSEFENKMFNLFTKPGRVDPPISQQGNLFMQIANRNELNIKTFLNYAFRTIDPNTHAKRSRNQDPQMINLSTILSSIFSQLKRQIP
jgi:hypothetical protein